MKLKYFVPYMKESPVSASEKFQMALLLPIVGFAAATAGVYLIHMLQMMRQGKYDYLPGTVWMNGAFTGPVFILGGIAAVIGSLVVQPMAAAISITAVGVGAVGYYLGRRRTKTTA